MASPGTRWQGLNSGGRFDGGSSGRRGGSGWGAGGGRGRGRAGGSRRTLCRNIQQGGRCRFGAGCTFSHDLSNSNSHESPLQPRERLADTPEQQHAREDYNSWKRLIKTPPKRNDIGTIELLWNGALTILNADDRDWKQMLPRDLDDQENYGREHIQTLLSMVAHTHGCSTFVALAQPFLLVITHQALLDCLSVDTFVGGLYNFISGSNGTRAIPFFQRLNTNLVEAYLGSAVSESSVETMLIAMSTAIRELLRREQRAAFHDDLPDLVNSLENAADVTGMDKQCVAFQIVINRIGELRATIARANGLLNHEEVPRVSGVSTAVATSTYPRDIIVPGDRHDNDNTDITKIQILPTEMEIRSNLPEFLPSTDLDQPHFLNDQAERHLDTHFRLLRHDIFGELKETLGGVMIAIENDPTLLDNGKLGLGNMRAYPYAKAYIRYISFDQRRGLEARISFDQLSALRKKPPSERRKWWEESKRLEEGVLLCFVSVIDNKSSLLFFTVSEKCTDPKKDYSLSSHEYNSTITTKLATQNQVDMELMTQLSCRNVRGALIEFPGVVLATFVPILENLQNMQRLSRLPFRQWILPDRITTFRKGSELLDIPPPLYARAPGFVFSLDSILKEADGGLSVNSRAPVNKLAARDRWSAFLDSILDKPEPDGRLSLDPRASVDDVAIIDELEAQTELDRGQCQALIAALTREFAFIQGPPGTGKSYLGVQLMRVLLACKRKAHLGPIVVVCYTNHALDQFLEHLIKVGIEKVIRIGGQSRSTILEGKNLRVVSQGEPKTKSEGYLIAMTYKALEIQERLIRRALGLLHNIQKQPDWANLKTHLARRHPRICSQFSRVDDEGFKTVGRDPFEIWSYQESKTSIDTSTSQSLLDVATRNVHALSRLDRRRLVEFWAEEIREATTDQLFELVKEAFKLHKQLDNMHDEVDRRVLQTADVIGVTTTGLARRISVLRRVRCKVIICEEAGEVMEPHMISALLPNVEHFIQIGDHQQLRPQINSYGLSLESRQGTPYQLDRSQFERLSVGERGRPSFPVAQLNVQRRMRPEISNLIRETIYPRLNDHESIKHLPAVVGMRKNVFWLDHDSVEEGPSPDRHQRSHSNIWEAEMTHALVRHIVRQGVYSSSDIAVLTPYTGQLQKLREKMRNDFEVVLSERDQETLARDRFDDETTLSEGEQANSGSGRRPLEKKKLSEMLRVATVDNFQGEEAKIVIVSLVRSNKEKKVGFLRTTNRINVLLSRAQHGMYLIGNTDTYSNVPMWAQVLRMLQATDSVGKAFGLCCPRHVDTEMQAFEPIDFEKLSPEGGCQLPCDRRLTECGHRCQAKCHSESLHRVFECPQPCQRLHSPCNHSCQKQTCGEDCGPCMIRLNNIRLPCTHSKDDVLCHQTLDLSRINCSVPVQKQVPGCNHIVEVPCSRDVASSPFSCPTACGIDLACGHRCPGTCGQCYRKDANDQPVVKHASCTKVCGRRLGTCNHICRRFCHDGADCGLCFSACEVRCSHSRCTLRCHQSCAPCIERCTWSCEHKGNCGMPCAAPCSRLPCNQRCSKTLSCGHQCPGICGEVCHEDYCHVCSDKRDSRVDLLEMKTYGEIDLDETPIVILGCGHFFTAETLDGHMGMTEVYAGDGCGGFTGLQDVSAVLARSMPRCPDCQCPVRQYATQRYNRVINRAVIDEMSKRFLVSGRAELRELELQVADLERGFETSRSEIIRSSHQAKTHFTANLTPAKTSEITRLLKERHEKSGKIEKAIQTFRDKIADKHQPAQKLHEARVHAARKAAVDQLMADLSFVDAVPALARDRQITLGGRMAQIRTEFVVLNDKFSIAQALKSTPAGASIKIAGGAPGQLATPFFQTCKTFIGDCEVENLPKLAVEASLFYASIARSYESFCHSVKTDLDKAANYVKMAKELLDKAQELCRQPFQNAEILRSAIEESIGLLRKEWYEEVTAEEITAIKSAMVSGSGGIATHSGHWYNCENGHPFAIGDCGMPMELARCPECGAPVGGQHHRAVDGVTRAMNMED